MTAISHTKAPSSGLWRLVWMVGWTLAAGWLAACSSATPAPACPEGQICAQGGSGGGGAAATGGASASRGFTAQAPDFSLPDVNATSPRYQQSVSPRDYLQGVSAWYFGHAT